MKRILILAFLSVIMAGVSFYFAPSYDRKTIVGTKVFPNLGENIDRIKTITINSKHGQVNIIKRTDGTFSLKEEDNYPVKLKRAKEIILGLANLEYFETKTADKDNFTDLEVEDVSENSKSVEVILKDEDDKVLADIILGDTVIGASGFSSGIYIRKAQDNQAYLARRSFDATGRKLSFIDHRFPTILPETVKYVTINQHDKSVDIKDSKKFENLFKFFVDNDFFEVIKDDKTKASFVTYDYVLNGGVTINVGKVPAEKGNPLVRITVKKGKAVSDEAMKTYGELQKLEGWLYKIPALNLGYLLEIKK